MCLRVQILFSQSLPFLFCGVYSGCISCGIFTFLHSRVVCVFLSSLFSSLKCNQFAVFALSFFKSGLSLRASLESALCLRISHLQPHRVNRVVMFSRFTFAGFCCVKAVGLKGEMFATAARNPSQLKCTM